MAFSWLLRKRNHESPTKEPVGTPADVAATICLRVEDGLLMAFGPDDDPMPPALVKSLCADDPKGTLQLESGETIDKRRVLDVLEAQQKGPLSDERHDGWIQAMLRLGGAFEPTAPELLAEEPLGMMPSPPKGRDGEALGEPVTPPTEVLTPIAFDDAERGVMAEADAILLRGFEPGVSLSAGHYEPMFNGWILRPRDLPSLSVLRAEDAPKAAEIDVTAVSLRDTVKRWPIATKKIELA